MKYFAHHFLGQAGIAQLGERQTEDLKVPGSIPGHGRYFFQMHRNASKFVTAKSVTSHTGNRTRAFRVRAGYPNH